MNSLATQRTGTALAAPEKNTFESYGDTMNQRFIVGKLLKFSKGDWLAGEHSDEIATGTHFIANMDELLIGWTRWEGGRPTEHVMGHVAQGFAPPKRSELGDNDKDEWEVDERNEPRDPWQFTNYLLLQNADGELFTFTTSSRGGLNCIGSLCKDYGKAMRQKPDEFPVVEIGTDSYMHPNKALGRIKVPTLKIVAWKAKTAFVVDDAAPADEAPAGNAGGKRAAGATRF